MKPYSRMRFVTMMLIGAAGITVLAAEAGRAGQDETAAVRMTLQEEAAAAFSQHRYEEFLAALEQRAANARTDAERLTVVRYQLAAKSAYLDYLEKEEQWKEYYCRRPLYDQEIIAAVKEWHEKLLDSRAHAEWGELRFFAWRAYQREEDAAGEAKAFAELADMLCSATAAAPSAVVQDIAARIAQTGAVGRMNELLRRYREQALRRAADAGSPEQMRQIADEHRRAGDLDVAAAVYGNYARLALDQYPQAQALAEIRTLINDFAATGFAAAPQAGFAEELYAMAEERYGAQIWDEDEVFMRAVNQELDGSFPEAAVMYERFAAAFPQSRLLPETETRRGFLLMFRLNDPAHGAAAWEGVAARFPDSAPANFCRYWAGVYAQWKQDAARAGGLLKAIPESEPVYGEMARQRLNELEQKQPADKKVSALFDRMLNPAPDNPVEMTLTVNPGRVFVDQDVTFEGSAQDFSAGSVQPQFTYEWAGQTGQVIMTEQDPLLTTRYQTPGPQLVWLGASTENTKGAVAQVSWNYGVRVSVPQTGGRVTARRPENLSAELDPPLPDVPQVSWTWKFSGPAKQSAAGRQPRVQFDDPGSYSGEVRANAGSGSVGKKFTLEVVP